jgi:hypothetical protein
MAVAHAEVQQMVSIWQRLGIEVTFQSIVWTGRNIGQLSQASGNGKP